MYTHKKISKNAHLNLYCKYNHSGGCKRWHNAGNINQCLCGRFVKANAPVMVRGYGRGIWGVGQMCPNCLNTTFNHWRYVVASTCNCCNKYLTKRVIVARYGKAITLAKAQKSKNPNILRALAGYYKALANGTNYYTNYNFK